MAEALTEVVLELRLPASRLATLLGRGRPGRIVLQPVSTNGSAVATRFLATTQGIDAERRATEEALGDLFARVEPLREERGATSYLAELKSEILEGVSRALARSLGNFSKELVGRPILIADGRIILSFVTIRAGPLEEGLRTLIDALSDEGIPAHILRMGNQHPAEQTLGLYDDRLTEKQAEILRLALALGLYDTPRRCTLESLAHIFGISKAAAHSRMKHAERKVLQQYFEV